MNWLYLIEKWDVLKLNFRVLFKRSLSFFFFFSSQWSVSGAFCSAGVVVVGVATEKPGPTSALQGASLTGEKSNLSIIYLFWGLVWIQRSRAFRWQLYRNLVNESNSFWLDPFFSVVLEAPECPTEKLWLASATCCGWQWYNHQSVNCRWLLGWMVSHIQMSGAGLLTPAITHGMAAFGWCSTEKPAVFTWPGHAVCEAAELRARTHTHPYFKVAQLATVSYECLFYSLFCPLCFFSPAPNLHWSSRGAIAHTVTLHV